MVQKVLCRLDDGSAKNLYPMTHFLGNLREWKGRHCWWGKTIYVMWDLNINVCSYNVIEFFCSLTHINLPSKLQADSYPLRYSKELNDVQLPSQRADKIWLYKCWNSCRKIAIRESLNDARHLEHIWYELKFVTITY